jgi:hypothetical protein
MAKVGRAAFNSSRMRVETLSADKTITSAEAGEVYLVGAAVSVTLPAAEDGAYFKFILSADITSATALVITAAGSSVLKGAVMALQGTSVSGIEASDGADTILTVGSTANDVLAGSFVECVCDGTDWVITGQVIGDNADINATAFS